jgi:hypothetical protein
MNAIVYFSAALVPLIVGFAWYHPKVFGTAWMKANGVNGDSGAPSNQMKTFALMYVLSLMLTFVLQASVIHQMHFQSLLTSEPGFGTKDPEVMGRLQAFHDMYGDRFRTFGHGALHGTIMGVFFVLPVVGITALRERRSGKYIFIHTGYYMLTLALVGGILCQFIQL